MAGATGYVVEEKFLGEFEDLDPYKMAGIEGLWAISIWVVVLPILQFIPCEGALCPHGVVEDSIGAFLEYGKQPMHFLWSSLVILFMPLFYSCGLSITKYGSAS